MAQTYPNKMLVYNTGDAANPVYVVVANVNDVPETQQGKLVGVYTLSQIRMFRVVRDMKAP